jgi:hypothetical protein
VLDTDTDVYLSPMFEIKVAGVNFTIILRAAFLQESFLRSFYVFTIWVCNFLVKGFWHKTAHKMLVKLTLG